MKVKMEDQVCLDMKMEVNNNGLWMGLTAKMAKYHHFQKFVAKKHCFGTIQGNTTFLELEFHKLEFLISLFLRYSSFVSLSTIEIKYTPFYVYVYQ